jgi:hypothetical protein
VVQLLHLLPMFRVRLSAPAIRLMLSRDHEFCSTRKPAIAVARPEDYSKNHNKRAAMIGCPQSFGGTREGYFGACTTIRLAVIVKVPLMLGMGLPSRS